MNSRRSVILTTSSSEKARTNAYQVSSVGKALDVLCSFTWEKPTWSLSDLSRHLGLPKSTTHNLLRTLEQFDFVHQDEEDRSYRLGSRVFELGMLFQDRLELKVCALPHLRRLAAETGETVKLALLSGGRALVVAAVESSQQLHTRGDTGQSWPLHSTSLGKAILSCLSADEVDSIVEWQGLRRLTPRTITTLKGLQQCIEDVKKQGYALDCQENERGVHCIAVPVPVRRGLEPASLSVSGPSTRLSRQKLRSLAPVLRETAGAISDAANSSAQRLGAS